MENYTLNISTNAVAMPVVRDGENVGEIKICPDDTVFLGKFYALLPKLEAQRTKLAGAMPQNDTKAALAVMQSLWQQLRADIDEVFGKGTSDTAFGDTCSLAMAQQFFEGVGNALQNARSEKITAYTQPAKAVLK